MKQNALLDIARKVYGEHTQWTGVQLQRLEMLANEIESAEREECAKVCDDWPSGRDDVYEISKAIRARSQA